MQNAGLKIETNLWGMIMKNIKWVIIFILLTFTVFLSTHITNESQISNIYSQEIAITGVQRSLSDYYSLLVENADDNNIVILNAQNVHGDISWYCIGTKCDLNDDEYYTTYNDSGAKNVLPFKMNSEINIYSFSMLKNIDISNMTFTLIGDEENISSFLTDISNYEFGVTTNDTNEMKINQTKLITLSLLSLMLMYVIVIFTNSKQFVLEKYNGVSLFENFRAITFAYLKACVLLSLISVIILYLTLDNNTLFIKSIPIMLILSLVCIFITVIVECIISLVVRKLTSFSSMANSINNFSKNILFINFILIMSFVGVRVSSVGFNIHELLVEKSNLPSQTVSELYTYSLTSYGNVDLNYLNEVVDPLHAEFYEMTEDKYGGIVAAFQNYPTEVPIVNENYLEYIGKQYDEISSSTLNLLTTTPSESYGYNDINIIKASEESYPYIDQTTGKIKSYTGPLLVINSDIAKQFDPVLVSIALQSNTYYLNIDSTQLEAVNELIANLGLSQNVSSFYHPNSIGNDYYVYIKTEFVKNITILAILLLVLGVNFSLYVTCRYKMNKRKIALQYVNGDTVFKLLFQESFSILVVLIMITLIMRNIYNTAFTIFLGLAILMINMCLIRKILNSVNNQLKE